MLGAVVFCRLGERFGVTPFDVCAVGLVPGTVALVAAGVRSGPSVSGCQSRASAGDGSLGAVLR